MPTKIVGFVLRCTNKEKTTEFYKALGLTATPHQHPSGPIHFGLEPLADKNTEFVVELYDIRAPRIMDAIMLEVDSIERTLAIAKEFGTEAKTRPKISNGRMYVYITGPDNRDIMLIEQKKPEQITG